MGLCSRLWKTSWSIGKTERAAKLRRRVAMRWTQLGIRTPSSTLQQQLPQFEGVPVNESDWSVQPRTDTLMAPQKTVGNSDPTSVALRAGLNNHSQGEIPKVTNTPESILSAWTALEVLSPPAFRRPEDFA